MIRTRTHIAALVTINVGLSFAVCAHAGSWQSNASFGATLQGDLYTPTTPAAKPAVMVAIHYCGGNSGSAHGWFQSAADQNGFYIIAPNAGKNCFDSSAARSGDPAAIVKMVQYVITNKSADSSRVFAAGYSSGGCMTNTLLAVYPDVFAGGAALPGYPAGAWPAGDTSCQLCGGSGPSGSDTGQKYADIVKKAFTWSGARPCVQEWVGGADEYHFAQWFPVVASEFQILMNLDSGSAGTGAPSGWTRTDYKDSSGHVMLQMNMGPSGQKHDLTSAGLNGQVISFLGLDKPTGACGLTSTASGGSSSTGGASGVGGTDNNATGGTSSKATGGSTSAAGGTSSFAGGSKATGGSAIAAGGTWPVSDRSGGTGPVSTTGPNTTGGAISASGGTASSPKATGGAVGNGGTSSQASNHVTGGTDTGNTTTAALASTGGATTSGETGAGGSSNAAAAGNEAVGGESALNNTMPGSGDQGSCGCRVAGKNDINASRWTLGFFAIAFASLRRRQRKTH